MGPYPSLAFLFAFFNVLTIWAGGGYGIQIPLFVITLFFGVAGLIKPGEENPANGRTMAIFSIILAMIPFLEPYVQLWALHRREAIRAKETAPMYEELDDKIANYKPQLEAFYIEWGQYPPLEGQELLPMIGRQGQLLDVKPNDPPSPPNDSFDNSPMRVVPIGTVGAYVLSYGQDQQRHWPEMRYMLSIDGQPNDPVAPFAWLGTDLREFTYDPTNGALATGDIPIWVTHTDIESDEVLGRINDAWDDVHARTPPSKRKAGEEEAKPDESIDAANAADFLEDEEYLEAIIAASRAVQNRRQHPNFWQGDPHLGKADLYRAQALFELGHYRSAADFLIDYIVTSPNDAEGHYWLGVTLYLGRNLDDARKHFAAALQVDPQSEWGIKSTAAFEAIERKQVPDLPRPWILDHPDIYFEEELMEWTPPLPEAAQPVGTEGVPATNEMQGTVSQPGTE